MTVANLVIILNCHPISTFVVVVVVQVPIAYILPHRADLFKLKAHLSFQLEYE